MSLVAIAPELKSIELATGVRLPYVEQGDPTGVPIVFLHGYTDSWRSYEPVLPYLPESFHAYALTQRGHGDADRPATGYAIADFVADLAAFLDALGIERAVIIGHSMGSVIAQHFAIDYPDRALGLVLAGALTSFHGNAVVVEFGELVATLEDPIDPAFARDFQVSTLAQPIADAYLETVVAESLKLPARVWREAFANFLTMPEWSANLGEITAPTRIIWGDQDVFSPRADQELLASAIGDAALIVYNGAGHAMHWEEPARFAADVAALIGSR